LFGGLVALASNWSARRATALAVAAGADFSCGLWQVWAHNASAATARWQWLPIGLSLAAPLFACAFLLFARQHARLYE
jgi:hypothetical protein